MADFDVIVIGAGANGLVAAGTLAAGGLRVLVVERSHDVGGQARTVEFAPGFRASPLGDDAGWCPPRAAAAAGAAGLESVFADTPLSVAIGRGELLPIARDPVRAATAIGRHSPADAAQWRAFAERIHALARFLGSLYEAPAPRIDATGAGELRTLLGHALRFRRLGRAGMTEFLRTMPMSVRELLDDTFELEPLKAAIATAGVQGSPQGPRSGGTAFLLLHYLVGAPAGCLRGRGHWRAGPGALVATAESTARARGVAIRTGAAVAGIAVRADAVTGIVLEDGEEVPARHVLSTADPARTLLGLIDPVWLDPEFLHKVRSIRFRGSTGIVLHALADLPPVRADGTEARDVLAGVVSLTAGLDALEQAADAVKYGTVAARLHVELTAPSLLWPELAPAGQHVVVARVRYVPYGLRDGTAWGAVRRGQLGDAVTAAIDAALPSFADRVLHRVVLTPADLEATYGLTEGAFTHGELALDQILFMRPVAGAGRYAMPIQGLWLGGSGAHPGPGIPGGAGFLAAKRLLHERRRA